MQVLGGNDWRTRGNGVGNACGEAAMCLAREMTRSVRARQAGWSAAPDEALLGHSVLSRLERVWMSSVPA